MFARAADVVWHFPARSNQNDKLDRLRMTHARKLERFGVLLSFSCLSSHLLK